jgi:hypothetical protein
LSKSVWAPKFLAITNARSASVSRFLGDAEQSNDRLTPFKLSRAL